MRTVKIRELVQQKKGQRVVLKNEFVQLSGEPYLQTHTIVLTQGKDMHLSKVYNQMRLFYQTGKSLHPILVILQAQIVQDKILGPHTVKSCQLAPYKQELVSTSPIRITSLPYLQLAYQIKINPKY